MRYSRRRFLRDGLAAAGFLSVAGLVPRAAYQAFGQEDDFHRQLTALMLEGTDFASEEAKRPLRILVLGGTAFLGPACVEVATARGHELTLFNRGRTNAHLYPHLEQIHGDRNDGHEALAGREWDVVIDTSGYVPRVVDDAATTLRDHVDHYCFVSTISVYDDISEPGVDEDDPVGTLEDPTVETVDGETYGPLKALCEQAAEEAMPGRVLTVRPGLIVGPLDRSDRFTYWPVRVSRGGEVLAPNRPQQHIQFVDVRDLASFIVHGLEERVAGTYNVTSRAGRFTMGGLLDTCREVSGSDATFTWCDPSFLEEQEVAAWSELPCWAPLDGDYGGLGDVVVDRALEKGLHIRPVEETVASTLEWWKTQPVRQEGPRTELRAGLDPEKEARVLAAWHAREKG